MKICKKCGSTEFYDNGECKPCRKIISDRYRNNNREKCIAATLKCHRENPEKTKSDGIKYRLENPEKRKETWRNWYEKNPAKSRTYKHTRRSKERGAFGVLSEGLFDNLFNLQKGKCACCK